MSVLTAILQFKDRLNYDHIEQIVDLNIIRGLWFVHANGLHKFYKKLSFIITGWNSIRSLYNVSIMQKSELDFSKSVFLLWRVIIKNSVCFYRRRNLVNLLSSFVFFFCCYCCCFQFPTLSWNDIGFPLTYYLNTD